MGLIGYLILVIVVGILVGLAQYIPWLPAEFKKALPIIALAILILVLLLYMFGGAVSDVQIPKFR